MFYKDYFATLKWQGAYYKSNKVMQNMCVLLVYNISVFVIFIDKA